MSQGIEPKDLEMLAIIKKIVKRGDTAEVRDSRDGLKVYAVRKHLSYGKPSDWDMNQEKQHS